MKKIGLIGGTSPESTSLYYKFLIEFSHKYLREDEYPEIIIYSVNFREIIENVRNNDWKSVVEKFNRIFNWMEKAQVEIGALTANTMHLTFDHLETKIKLIHIVDSVGEKALKEGYQKLVLFGTKRTMESNLYTERLKKYGIETIVPEERDREIINDIIFKYLVKGNFSKEIKEKLVKLAEKYLKNADALILGCTELPLILKDVDFNVMDTVEIHAKKIFEESTGIIVK